MQAAAKQEVKKFQHHTIVYQGCKLGLQGS